MFNDQELFHGAALALLVRQLGGVRIVHAQDVHSSAYLLESNGHKSAVLMKINRVRKKSPWQFTFSSIELKALVDLGHRFSDYRRFIALICRLDGVCCLSESQLFEVTGGEITGRAVSVRRPRDGSYRIHGPEGRKLKGAIPKNAWPNAIILKNAT
jgi:hypothetical protein